MGVVVPSSQHAGKIGRGGSALQDLQRKTGAMYAKAFDRSLC